VTAARRLVALIKSHISGDDAQFYAVAMQIAADEARQGHGRLAEVLKQMIDDGKARGAAILQQPGPVPMAQPKGELASLISVQYPETRLADMVLSEDLEARLRRVLLEQRQQRRLRSYGLFPRRKLLLIGPSGSGKTMTAAALAGELKLPLFTVVLDGLISKFMGETAAKLRFIFEAMNMTKGVYLFDEFDAIGARRADPNDVGEVRRILNSFLQFLEQDASQGLIIAATNHGDLLDPALFRRFDDVIEYGLPKPEFVRRLLLNRLTLFDTSALDWSAVFESAAGLSYAEIARAADEAAKDAVLANVKQISMASLVAAFTERRRSTSSVVPAIDA